VKNKEPGNPYRYSMGATEHKWYWIWPVTFVAVLTIAAIAGVILMIAGVHEVIEWMAK
jgi:hypothetical protein